MHLAFSNRRFSYIFTQSLTQTIDMLKIRWQRKEFTDEQFEQALEEIRAQKVWDVVPPEQPYGSLDALLMAEIGIVEGASEPKAALAVGQVLGQADVIKPTVKMLEPLTTVLSLRPLPLCSSVDEVLTFLAAHVTAAVERLTAPPVPHGLPIGRTPSIPAPLVPLPIPLDDPRVDAKLRKTWMCVPNASLRVPLTCDHAHDEATGDVLINRSSHKCYYCGQQRKKAKGS